MTAFRGSSSRQPPRQVNGVVSRKDTPDGLLWYNQEVIIRPDIYKAACVGHTLFDMTAIDHAHRYVMFPAVEPELPSAEKILEVFEALELNNPQQDCRAKAEQDLQSMRAQSDFRLGVQEKVREFAGQRRRRLTNG
jgi:hypothetical protein